MTVLDRFNTAHIDADRRIELERPTARSYLRGSEHHADLLTKLIDEDARRLAFVQVAGELTQRLGHQSSLEAHMAVAHLAFDFGTWYERGHRVNDHNIERS